MLLCHQTYKKFLSIFIFVLYPHLHFSSPSIHPLWCMSRKSLDICASSKICHFVDDCALSLCKSNYVLHLNYTQHSF